MADSQRKTANLFDKNATDTSKGYVAENRYLRSNGNLQEPSGETVWHVSEYIDISSYTNITISGLSGNASSPSVCFYDDSYEYISGNSFQNRTSFTVNVPNNAKYIRLSIATTTVDNYMLNSGSTVLPFEPYWQHSLRKLTTSTDTLTTLPADLYADGQSATVELVGNMSQTGTPTPQTPIQPQECGDRTGNLFNPNQTWYATNKLLRSDGTLNDNTSFNVSDYTEVEENTEYYLNNCNRTSTYPSVCFYDANKTYISGIQYNGATFVAFTTPQNCKYIMFSVVKVDIDIVMLNLGSTALPYEPYGIKIPISSASTTTNIYLGEVQTTRKIVKKVFNGAEYWEEVTSGNLYFAWDIASSPNAAIVGIGICTHLPYTTISASNTNEGFGVQNRVSNTRTSVLVRWNDFPSLSDWTTYLQQQYAAGTPVTVWYVLATPTTGIVNEPLRKIGDYADTVSGITIPTIAGADSFDVLTTLKPSEVSLAYTGWHDATVKEWDGSEWQ